MKFKLIGFLLCCLPFLGLAQSKKLKKLYNQAKQQFNQQNYSQSLLTFQEVIGFDEENQLIENAHFYYALSAYRGNILAQAKPAFEQVLSKYPNSEVSEDAHYFLADIAFKNNEPEQAFRYLQKIKSADLQREAKQMKGFFGQKMDLLKLRFLQQTFLQDTLVAQLLVDKIATTSDKEDDYILLENLLTTYKLEPPKNRKLEKVMRVRKPAYKVAVMLPFDLKKAVKDRDTSSISKLSLQFYQGMRVAQRELDTLGQTKIKLLAYDMTRESEQNRADTLLLNQELKDVDFVIGPLFENAYKKIAEAAEMDKINVIQPFSFDSKYLQNRFTYLYQPSQETQARQALVFAKNKFPNKSIIIFYDNLAKNKIFAQIYKAQAEQAGLQVLAYEQVSSTDVSKLASILGQINPTKVGSIFISSTSQLIAAELLKQLQEKIYDVPVFAPDSWLNFQQVDYTEYENRNVHFIYPDFIKTESLEALKFKKAYTSTEFSRGQDPSNHAYLGYEMLHFIAKLLQENGSRLDYTALLQKMPAQPGIVNEKLDFTTAHDNQFVPILKIVQGEVEMVK
ncbi:MAG: ABC transporter substrate-binding protein [Microscillaceae bacterium]|jgi:ABC-type branched-subunit amino acid transport system substrate-binding protein|nr:ABC transporter substrate-binding protein [Microscillaceae bacterium]